MASDRALKIEYKKRRSIVGTRRKSNVYTDALSFSYGKKKNTASLETTSTTTATKTKTKTKTNGTIKKHAIETQDNKQKKTDNNNNNNNDNSNKKQKIEREERLGPLPGAGENVMQLWKVMQEAIEAVDDEDSVLSSAELTDIATLFIRTVDSSDLHSPLEEKIKVQVKKERTLQSLIHDWTAEQKLWEDLIKKAPSASSLPPLVASSTPRKQDSTQVPMASLSMEIARTTTMRFATELDSLKAATTAMNEYVHNVDERLSLFAKGIAAEALPQSSPKTLIKAISKP